MTDSALPPLPSLDQTARFFSTGTAPVPQRSALDDLVIRGREELDKKDEQAWASSMRVAIQTNPGVAAEADRLARQVGLPIGDATQRIDFLRGVSLMERMRQDRIRETNPVLYKSLQSIEFARKAWDDYEHLSSLERWGKDLRRGMLTSERGRAALDFTPEGRKRFEAIDAELRTMAPSSGGFVGNTAEVVGQWAVHIPRALAGGLAGAGAAATGAAIYGQLGPQALVPEEAITVPAAAMAGFNAGFLVQLSADLITSDGGNAYADMIAAGYEDGWGTWIAAGSVGIINAALELAGGHLATSATRKLIGEQVFKRGMQEVAKFGGRSWERGFLMGYAVPYVGNVAQEGAQELVQIVAEELAATDGVDNLSPEGVASRLWEVVSKTAQGMALLSVPGGVAGGMRGRYLSEIAKANQKLMAEGNAAAGKSRLMKDDPTGGADYVGEVLRQGEIQDGHVDAKAFDELLRKVDEAGAASGELRKSTLDVLEGIVPGISEQLERALEIGGDVTIPLADVVSHIRGQLPEFAAGLEPLLRTAPDGVAAADVTPEGAERVKQAAGEADTGSDAEAQFYGALDKIQRETAAQVFQMGGQRITKEQARYAARVYGAAIEQVARAEGLDPEAAAKKYGVTFQADETTGRAQFQPAERRIVFGPNSDVSSMLHEVTHWFTEVAERLDAAGSTYGKTQLDALLAHWKITREQWAGMDTAARNPLLEDVAHNAEDYFATGKAPSEELRGVFQKLRAFIVSLYRNVRAVLEANYSAETKGGKLSPISDDLRGFFDRMLAAEHAIESERSVRAGAMRMSDATAKAIGIEGESLAEVRSLEDQRIEEAKEELTGELVRGARYYQAGKRNAEADVKRALKAAEDKIRGEVEREVDSAGVHAAVRYIRTGEYLAQDGTIQKENSAQKLDALKVREILGLPRLRRVGKVSMVARIRQLGGISMEGYPGDTRGEFKVAPGVFRKNGGQSWERVAEQLASEGYGGQRYDSNATDNADNSWLLDALADAAQGVTIYPEEFVSDVEVMQAEAEAFYGAQDQTGEIDAARAARASSERSFVALARRGLLRRGLDQEVADAYSKAKSAKGRKLSEQEMREIRARVAGKYEAGANPDEIAGAFGFGSGAEMLRAILNAPPRDEAVAARVRERLEAEEPLADPQRFKAAVEKALHGKTALRLAATVLRAMMKGVRVSTSQLMAEAREAARIALLRTPVGRINVRAMAAAEFRAAQRRDRAIASGKVEDAIEAQRQFLVQHYLTVEAAKVETEVRRAVERNDRNYGKADDQILKERRNLDYVNAGRLIMGRFGMLGQVVVERARADMETMRELDADGFAKLERRMVDATSRAKAWREVALDEFRVLAADLDGLWSESHRAEQVRIDGKMRDIAEVRAELEDRAIQTFGGKRNADGIVEVWERVPRYLGGDIMSYMTRLEAFTRMVDGEAGGPWHRYVYQPLKDATVAAELEKAEHKAWIEAWLREFGPLTEKIDTKRFFGDGNALPTTLAEVVGLLLHLGTESGERAVVLGNGLGHQVKGDLVTRLPAILQELADAGKITEQHFKQVQKLWDYIAKNLRERVFKTSREVWGFWPKEVEAKVVQTPFGTIPGGYFPAKVDHEKATVQTAAKLDALSKGGRDAFVAANPSVPRGMTIQRQNNVVQPRVLDLAMVGQHMDESVNIIHLQPAISDMARLFGGRRNTMAATLAQVLPKAQRNIITPALDRMARDTIEAPTNRTIRGIVRWARKGASLAFLGFNPRNAAQQFTGLFNAVPEVGASRLWSAIREVAFHPGRTVEQIVGKSDAMRARWSDAMQAAAQDIQQILNPSTARWMLQQAQRAAFFLQRLAQQKTDAIVWKAAYEKAVAELGPGMEVDKLDAEAVRRADSAVRLTQGEKTPLDVPTFLSGNAVAQLFTQFADYPNTVLNQNIAAKDGQRFAVFAWTVLAPTLASSAIALAFAFGKVGRTQDQGDPYEERLAKFIFGDQVRGIVGMVPLAGPLAASALNELFGLTNDPGGLRNQPFASWQMFLNLGNVVAGEAGFADALAAIAFGIGAPARPLVNVTRYQERIASGREPQGDLLDYLRVVLNGR